MDVRLLSLLVPAIFSVVGFFCFTALGYSFTEIETLPAALRTTLVLVGAFALAIGSEIGTLPSVVEIYRKPKRGFWDYTTLSISVLTTVVAFVLSFALLLGANAEWSPVVKRYGPIFLGVLASFDATGGMLELGLYLYHKPTEEAQADERRRESLARQLRFELWKAQTIAQHQAQMAALTANDETAQLRAQLRDTNAQLDATDSQLAQLRAATLLLDGVGGQPDPVAAVAEPATKPPLTATPPLLDAKRAAIIRYYRATPMASQEQAATEVGCSRSYVGKVLAQLESTGIIRRNGHGVEVLREEQG